MSEPVPGTRALVEIGGRVSEGIAFQMKDGDLMWSLCLRGNVVVGREDRWIPMPETLEQADA